MANLKLTTTEASIVKGKRVSNIKSHNITDINNIYQETINLNKRPADYTYLYVAEVPGVDQNNEHIFIEAHTDRSFGLGTTGNGIDTNITFEPTLATASRYILDQETNARQIAIDMRASGDVIPTSDSSTDGADDRVISVTSVDTFVAGANGADLDRQETIFWGNQKAFSATMSSGQKYITHAHTPATDIKVGMRIANNITGQSYVGASAVITRIVSDTEFEVDVASAGTGAQVVYISDTIKIKFSTDVTQANSTQHEAGVDGIFGEDDGLTNRKAVLTSLKKSLDLCVAAGAPFIIGGVTDNGTLPYLKITHANAGHSVQTREIYGAIVKNSNIFSFNRTTAVDTTLKTNTFFSETVSPTSLVSFSDTIRSSGLITRSGGSSSFSSDDVKYTRITNNGVVNTILYIHVGNYDAKTSGRYTAGDTNRNSTIETNTGDTADPIILGAHDENIYILDILTPGESKIYYDNKVDITNVYTNAPKFTEIDNIYGISESATVNGSVEVFVASK